MHTQQRHTASPYADSAQDLLARLHHMVDKQGGDVGRQRMRELLPLLIIAARKQLKWSAEIDAVMTQFGRELGVADDTPAAEIRARVERYYADPVRAQLVTELRAMLREVLASGVHEVDGAASALRFLLRTPVTLKRSQPAAKGSMPAGPIARFAMAEKKIGPQ